MKDYVLPDYLLVNPALPDDPLGKQDKIGLLVAGYPKDDEFIIRFEDDTHGIYKAGDLLSLRSNQEIFDHLEAHGAEMPKADFRAMYNMTLFQEYGTLRTQKLALVLGMSNENLRQCTLQPLSEQLGNVNRRTVGR